VLPSEPPSPLCHQPGVVRSPAPPGSPARHARVEARFRFMVSKGGEYFYSVSHHTWLRVEKPWGRDGGRGRGTHPTQPPTRGPSPRLPQPRRAFASAPGTVDPQGWGARPPQLPWDWRKGHGPPGAEARLRAPSLRCPPWLPHPDGEGEPPGPPETPHRREQLSSADVRSVSLFAQCTTAT